MHQEKIRQGSFTCPFALSASGSLPTLLKPLSQTLILRCFLRKNWRAFIICAGALKLLSHSSSIRLACFISMQKRRSTSTRNSLPVSSCTTSPSSSRYRLPFPITAESILAKSTSLLLYIFAGNSFLALYLRPILKLFCCVFGSLSVPTEIALAGTPQNAHSASLLE